MFDKFAARVSEIIFGRSKDRRLEAIDQRDATAALLVHAISIDGVIEPAEKRRLRRMLRAEYDLDDAAARELIARARKLDAEAVDLYTFTSVLTRALDQKGRKHVVAMLWDMVYADGDVHEFEDNLVWRVAELLGVSTRDRIRLKKEAARNEDD